MLGLTVVKECAAKPFGPVKDVVRREQNTIRVVGIEGIITKPFRQKMPLIVKSRQASLTGAGAFRSTPEVLQEEISSRYSGPFVIGRDLDVY